MSPLQITIILHVYAIAEEYPMAHMQQKFIDELITNGLIVRRPAGSDLSLAITAKGEAYVDALCAIPMPIQKWVMP